jgi:hypothetical protein
MKFDSKHSDLDLTLKGIQSLSIDATRTTITLSPEEFDDYNYSLVNKEGRVYVPEPYTRHLRKEGKENSLQLVTKPANPSVRINTSFNTITIK